MKSPGSRFKFTTMQIHFKYPMLFHVDSKNCGTNLIVGFGEYKRRREDFAKTEHMILFLGTSGAGKSKLLSVLLAYTDVLPRAGEGP